MTYCQAHAARELSLHWRQGRGYTTMGKIFVQHPFARSLFVPRWTLVHHTSLRNHFVLSKSDTPWLRAPNSATVFARTVQTLRPNRNGITIVESDDEPRALRAMAHDASLLPVVNFCPALTDARQEWLPLHMTVRLICCTYYTKKNMESQCNGA